MAFKIKKNTLFIKDKNTQELKPIGLFGSGSDKTMEEIKTYADTVRSETESAITLKANITLESIPDEYSELQNTVNSLKQDLTHKQTISKDYIFGDIFKEEYWEVGALSDSDGSPSSYNARLRTKDFWTLSDFSKVVFKGIAEGYRICCYCYKEDGTYIDMSSTSQIGYKGFNYNYYGNDGDELFPASFIKYKFVLRRDDNANMSVSEIYDVKSAIHLIGTPKNTNFVSNLQLGDRTRNNLEYDVKKEFYFRKGNINSNGSINEKHAHRYYTPIYYYFNKGTVLKCNDGYQWGIHYYENYGMTENTILSDETNDFELPYDGYYRLVCYESPYDDVKTLDDILDNVFIYGSNCATKAYVENEIEKTRALIPSYDTDENFETEMQNVSDRVLALQNKNTFSFAFITDLHLDFAKDVQKQMYNRICKAIKYLSNNDNIMCVVMGGDNVDNVWFNETGSSIKWNKYATQFVRRELLEHCDVPLLIGTGNHDDNSIYDSAYNGESLNENNQEHIPTKTVYDYELYNYYCKFNENSNVVFGGKGKMYYYIDFPSQKIRLFVLNSIDIPYELNEHNALQYTGQWTYGYRNEQLNFVANALKFSDKDNPSEWSVIITKHISINPSYFGNGIMHNNDILVNILNAYKNGSSYVASSQDGDFPYDINVNYNNIQGIIISDIAGHQHQDINGIYENIPFIGTTTARYENRNEPSGEVTNTSFDIFTIDTENRTIKATRFGYGNDREFSY